jgi:hypothetical protein
VSTIADSTPSRAEQRFDRTAVKVNQAAIILLLAMAFVTTLPWLVAVVAVIMALGTAQPQLALFQRLYHAVLKPAGLLKPDVHVEDAAPHRFAQGMGASVLVVAAVALLAGAELLGWSLALLVAVLAAVNLFFGFCAGCFVYAQLARLRSEA